MKSILFAGLVALAGAQHKKFSEPSYTCPPEYELMGKECVQLTQAPPKLTCTQGRLVGNQCETPLPLLKQCPPGTAPQGKGCALKTIVPPTQACPTGFHDIGGECHQYNADGIVEICNQGVLENGQCKQVETAPAIQNKQCPIGYTERKGSCFKVITMECTPPHTGKGRQLAGLNQVTPYQPPQQKLAITQKTCEVKLEAPKFVTEACPEGFVMETTGQCVQYSFLPTDVKCGRGESFKCFTQQSAPYLENCPAGTTNSMEGCFTQEFVPLVPSCPEGTIMQDKGCLRVAQPQVICPPNTTLQGNVCIGREVVHPTVQVSLTCKGKDCYQH